MLIPLSWGLGLTYRALEEAIVDVCIVNYPKDPIPFEENYELLLKVRAHRGLA